MGGGYYDRDVGTSSTSDGFSYTAYSSAAGSAMSQKALHADLSPHGRALTCTNESPIVVAMDVTRSRGDDSKIVYDKMPMLFGQLLMQGYLEDPAISFAAIGDATCDQAPLQVGGFATGTALDGWLTKLWLEEGGGGTGRESYELAAFFYARRAVVTGQGKGYFFFTGDEGFYPEVSGEQVARVLGGPPAADVPARDVFSELAREFHVFFVYPRKAADKRRGDIDAEIASRLRREGGKTGDVRVSLIWNTRNDLDLHVVAPSGEEIYYGHKSSRCRGELDVDMNVRGDSTKPVENIYWPAGGAPRGKYRVFVQNYAFHEPSRAEYDYRVEVYVAGTATRYDGKISSVKVNQPVCEFEFQGQAPGASAEAVYASYDDATILRQWGEVLPPENILVLDDSKAIVDAMLGAIALASGRRDLAAYLRDMKERGQTDERLAQVQGTLAALGEKAGLARGQVVGELPQGAAKRRRGKQD
jgi:hypothetical protein